MSSADIGRAVRVQQTKKHPRGGQGLIGKSVDFFVLATTWSVLLVVSDLTSVQVRSTTRSMILTTIIVATTLVQFRRRGLFQTRPTLPRTDEIARIVTSVSAGAAVAAVAVQFLDWQLGAGELLIGVVVAVVQLVITRGLLRSLASELDGHQLPARVVIVGSGEETGELAEVILDHPESRFTLVGIVGHLPVVESHGLAPLWLGPTDRLIELMHLHETASAIVTPTGFRGDQFRRITRDLHDAGFDVHLSTGVSRLWDGRFEVRSLAHEPLVVMTSRTPARWQLIVKRLVDLVGASVILTVALPVMALTALAIKLEDGGPALFRQARVGRKSTSFAMLKFRSMVIDAEDQKADLITENERTGPLFKVSNDPRVTRVGRFIRETSIDELPQLVNVIRGEMSLVGPRPALVEEEAAFDEELRSRFDVRPGISGLWQVEARRNSSFSAYRRLDLHYVENWTLALDLRILLATVEQVVVTLAMLPLRRVLPRHHGETIELPKPSDGIIDLRDRTASRLAAAQGIDLFPPEAGPESNASDVS